MNALRRRLKSWDGLAILSLALWPIFFFFSLASGQQVLDNGDISRFSFPAGLELAKGLAQGRLPLWEPSMGVGFPLLAEGNLSALYPPNLILYRLFPIHLAISYEILFHLISISIGMFFLCRACRLGTGGAWFAGLVMGFNGFTLAHLQHLSLLAAASWLPWMFFFQVEWLRARRQGQRIWLYWFLAVSAAVGLALLSGFPQIAALDLAALVAFGIIESASAADAASKSRHGRFVSATRRVFDDGAILVASILLGAAMAAVQLLPTLELLGYSARGMETGAGFFTSFSLDPRALAQFVLPFSQLGAPADPNLEYWAYVGTLPLMLAFIAPIFRRDARTWFVVLIGLVALVLSLGEHTPFYSLLSFIPIFNRFRVPSRFLFLAALAAAFLAGTTFDELANRLRELPNSSRLFVVSILLLAGGMIGLVAYRDSQAVEFWIGAWTWFAWLFIVFSVGIVALALFRRLNRAMFTTWTIGSTLLNMTLFALPFLSTVDLMSPVSALAQVPPVIRAMDSARSMYRIMTNVYSASLRPNRPMAYGKQSAQIYISLPLQRNEEYLNSMSSAMLNLMNVRYFLQYNGKPPDDLFDPSPALILDVLRQKVEIPPTRVAQLEIVSSTDGTENLPDGFVAGEITLDTIEGNRIVLPVRMGDETAEWTYGAVGRDKVKHGKPAESQAFPAYHVSIGHDFVGLNYVARYTIPSAPLVSAVSARSFLPEGKLDIASVSLVDATGHSTSLAALAHRGDFSIAFKSHAVTLLENRDVLPRAFLVHQAETVADDQALALMRQPSFRPDRIVLLSSNQTAPLLTENNGNAIGDEVTISDYAPERVVIDVKTNAAGYLLLTDTWYPGWQAAVDGQPAPIYRADYIFRAVPISPGQHTVTFEYHPQSFALGAWISASSLIVMGGLVLWSSRRRFFV